MYLVKYVCIGMGCILVPACWSCVAYACQVNFFLRMGGGKVHMMHVACYATVHCLLVMLLYTVYCHGFTDTCMTDTCLDHFIDRMTL